MHGMRIVTLALVLAAALPSPGFAEELVYDTDTASYFNPPASANTYCVAAGVAPGVVTVTAFGTSSGQQFTIVQCYLWQGSTYRGSVARKLGAPVSAAGPGTFTVGPGPVHVIAAVS